MLSLLYTLFLAQLVLFFDNGIPPSVTIAFKKELSIGDDHFGLLGSMIFAGQLVGSIIAGPILASFSTRYVLVVSLLIAIVTLLLFCLTSSYFLMCVTRLITGLCQVFFFIYLPVWADSFGTEIEKP